MVQQTFWISSRISSLLSRMQDWKMWRSISCRMGLIHTAQLCKANKQIKNQHRTERTVNAAWKKGNAIYFCTKIILICRRYLCMDNARMSCASPWFLPAQILTAVWKGFPVLLAVLMILCVSKRAKPEGPGQWENAAYCNGMAFQNNQKWIGKAVKCRELQQVS